MRSCSSNTKQGFSLIEVVAVLVLVGFIASMASFMVVPTISQFENTGIQLGLAEKGRLFMGRVVREFQSISNVTASTARSITYNTLDKTGTPHLRTLSWAGVSGDPVLIDGNSFITEVANFELRYFEDFDGSSNTSWTTNSSIIEVVLDLGVNGSVYTNRVLVRGIN